MSDVKYPNVSVKLVETDGNVFAIIGKVAKVLREKVNEEAAGEFKAKAFACHSYDEVLILCMEYVEVK